MDVMKDEVERVNKRFIECKLKTRIVFSGDDRICYMISSIEQIAKEDFKVTDEHCFSLLREIFGWCGGMKNMTGLQCDSKAIRLSIASGYFVIEMAEEKGEKYKGRKEFVVYSIRKILSSYPMYLSMKIGTRNQIEEDNYTGTTGCCCG